MKKYSAIKDMFYGKRGGYDTIKIDDNDITILDTIIKHDENLRIELKKQPKLLEIYIALDKAISELNVIETEHYYIEGFKFGFLLALDVFDCIK